MRVVLIVLLSFLAIPQAKASAIFNWLAVSGGGDASGSIELTDAAFASGQVSWSVDNPHPDPGYTVPPGPITSFDFMAYGNTLGSSTEFIGSFNFDLTIVGNELVGEIFANNTGNEVRMGNEIPTDSTLWVVTHASTDGAGNCDDDTCIGDAGRWILASAPTTVPEPLSAPLIGIGLLALARIRRRTSDGRCA